MPRLPPRMSKRNILVVGRRPLQSAPCVAQALRPRRTTTFRRRTTLSQCRPTLVAQRSRRGMAISSLATSCCPTANGIVHAAAAGQCPIHPDLPIIMMSAQNTLLTAVKAAERGAYEYLPKPFDLEGTDCRSSSGRCPPRRTRRPSCRRRRRRSCRSPDRSLAGDAGNLPGARPPDRHRPDRDDQRRERVPARNWSPARCTITASAGTARSSRSTWRRFRAS